MITTTDFSKKIQYTNVHAAATKREIQLHCETALQYGFQAVMLQPCWIGEAREILRGSGIRVASAVAYPMGGETTAMKVALAREVVRLGADEFDFQPNIGFLRSGLLDEFLSEIKAVVAAAEGRSVKSMSEFGFLTDDEKILCMTLAEEAGVDYVKNSSGIGEGGSAATPEVIRFMKQHLKGRARIKASGKIRTREQALALIDAGADLLGSSNGPALIDGDAQQSAVSY